MSSANIEDIKQKCQELAVNRSVVNITQVPAKNNDNVAICTATVAGGGRSASSFGIATSDMCGEKTDPQTLLNTAGSNAYTYANALFQLQALVPQEKRALAHSPPAEDLFSSPQRKAYLPSPKNGGGGNKPASEKQQALIAGLCRKQGLNLQEAVNSKYGLELNQLKGSQANELIRELQNSISQ
jgi:hypothetical protein